MEQVRAAWVVRLLKRDVRIMDVNLLGNMLNSASFFASTNLLIVAAAAGLFFGGDTMLNSINGLILVAPSPTWLIETKIALIIVVLARGLLDFIWAIRQLNYCLALLGAAPNPQEHDRHEAYVQAMSDVLNPAFNSFNTGVRGYYFALAGAAWIVSPWAMAAGAAGAFGLLLYRQKSSRAARGVARAQALIRD